MGLSFAPRSFPFWIIKSESGYRPQTARELGLDKPPTSYHHLRPEELPEHHLAEDELREMIDADYEEGPALAEDLDLLIDDVNSLMDNLAADIDEGWYYANSGLPDAAPDEDFYGARGLGLNVEGR